MADLESYLRCLADRRRRRLLYHLSDREATTVEDLCRVLAESGPDPDWDESGDSAGDVALELRHDHIPKLESLSVVEFDPRSGVVRVREIPAELETLLEATCRLDRRP